MGKWKCKCGTINSQYALYCRACGERKSEDIVVDRDVFEPSPVVSNVETARGDDKSWDDDISWYDDISCSCMWSDKLRRWARGIVVVCWIAAVIMFIGMIATAVRMGESKSSSRSHHYSLSSYQSDSYSSDEITGVEIFVYVIDQCILIFLCVAGGYVAKIVIYSFSIIVENAYLSIKKKES